MRLLFSMASLETNSWTSAPPTAVIECPLPPDGWSQRGQRVKIYYHPIKRAPPYPQCVASGSHKKTGEGHFYLSQLQRGQQRPRGPWMPSRNEQPKPLWVLIVYVSAKGVSFSGELTCVTFNTLGVTFRTQKKFSAI